MEWRELKVQRSSHVTCDSQHYSVPYEHVGKLIRVRLTSSRVTGFDGQQIVCEHPRLLGRKGQYSTEATHLPDEYRNVDGLWSREWFLRRAGAYGAATALVIEQLIDGRALEAQGFLDCRNVLDGLGKHNKVRLEAACQQIIDAGMTPSYTAIKRLMAVIDSDTKKPAPRRPAASTRKSRVRFEDTDGVDRAGSAAPAGALVRGADYYRRLDEQRGR